MDDHLVPGPFWGPIALMSRRYHQALAGFPSHRGGDDFRFRAAASLGPFIALLGQHHASPIGAASITCSQLAQR